MIQARALLMEKVAEYRARADKLHRMADRPNTPADIRDGYLKCRDMG